MFFSSWTDLARVLIVGTLAYVALIVMLRISGKRTLSKLNAFDLIVTIALGSTLATVLLTKDVSLAEGLLAFALLITLQWIVAWSSLRSARVRQWVKSEPRLLLFRGEYLESAMKKERITRGEIQAAIRSAGAVSVHEVEAVVLEGDGSLIAITSREEQGDASALESVRNFPLQ
ncbi:MAG: DUF421 domain-containing protein [Chthoniobacteraceae bacterium]